MRETAPPEVAPVLFLRCSCIELLLCFLQGSRAQRFEFVVIVVFLGGLMVYGLAAWSLVQRHGEALKPGTCAFGFDPDHPRRASPTLKNTRMLDPRAQPNSSRQNPSRYITKRPNASRVSSSCQGRCCSSGRRVSRLSMGACGFGFGPHEW